MFFFWFEVTNKRKMIFPWNAWIMAIHLQAFGVFYLKKRVGLINPTLLGKG
jgi:hypothetical protein